MEKDNNINKSNNTNNININNNNDTATNIRKISEKTIDTSYYYNLAYNILNDDALAKKNVNKALSCTNSTSTWMYVSKLTRNFAFEEYMHNSKATSDTASKAAYGDTFADILAELLECTSVSFYNKEENVIPLQVCNIIDSFARTLSEQNRSIFIRRYFFADSVEKIASRYKLSLKSVNNILTECRKTLNERLVSKNYIMRPATLLDGFTGIGDDLLIECEKPATSSYKHLILPLSIAAGILLVIGITVTLMATKLSPDKEATFTTVDTDDLHWSGSEPEVYTHTCYVYPYKYDGVVDINSLFDYYVLQTDSILETMCVSPHYADQYNIYYEEIGKFEDEILADCTGYINRSIGDDEDGLLYYYLSGHNSMEYLITQDIDNETFRLWKCDRIELKPDTTGNFAFILSWRYGIGGVEAIDSIIVIPALEPVHSNSADEDIFIVSNALTLYSDFGYIYDVFSEMNYSTTPWDSLTDTEYTFEEIEQTAVKLAIISVTGTVSDYILQPYRGALLLRGWLCL